MENRPERDLAVLAMRSSKTWRENRRGHVLTVLAAAPYEL